MVIPAGKVSLKARLVTSVALKLVISKTKVVTPLGAMISGLKVLVNAGKPDTVNVSEAVPLLPALDVRSPVVLTCTPGSLLVKSTMKEHVADGGTAPPL